MQTTIYYADRDAYIVAQVDRKARKERRSRSAVIFGILEDYFERGKPVEKILIDQGLLSPAELRRALEAQKKKSPPQQLGEILLGMSLVDQATLERAFEIQAGGMPPREEGTGERAEVTQD